METTIYGFGFRALGLKQVYDALQASSSYVLGVRGAPCSENLILGQRQNVHQTNKLLP